MYELTCPSCGDVSSLPFVRVGASAVCGRCGTRYLIGEEHVKRPTFVAGHAPPARPMPVADERRRIDDAGQVIGLSGLSEMMKREAERPPPGSSGSPAPGSPARPAASATPGPVASARHPIVPFSEGMSPSTRLMILLLMGVIGILALSGVLVWYNAQEHDGQTPNPPTRPPISQQP